MPTFREKSDQLTQLINQFVTARDDLFKYYEQYQNSTALQRYSSREIALSLLATVEYAQNCYTYYNKITTDGTLTDSQLHSLKSKFDSFQKRCAQDHIYYKMPRPRLMYYPNQTDTSSNIPKTIGELNLFALYLNGLSKMAYSVLGEYPQIIIDYTQTGGSMNVEGQLRIDVNMIGPNINVQLPANIILHECGHLDEEQFSDCATHKIPVEKLNYVVPSLVNKAANEDQKIENLADLFAAIVSSLYKVPLNFVYTRFSDEPIALTSTDPKHPSGTTRADLLQNTVSIFDQHFNDKKNKNNRWTKFANNIRAIPRIAYKDLPTFADLDSIYQQSPQDTRQQSRTMQAQFPALFTYTTRGDFPPPVLVASDLQRQIASISNPAFFQANRANVPLISVGAFQAKWNAAHPFPEILPAGALRVPALPPPVPAPGTHNHLSGRGYNAPALDVISQNLMLGTVLIHMGKQALSWLAPRWVVNNTCTKLEIPDAPATATAGKKTLRSGAC